MQFSLFVYGTLKRGERNFERYCRGALSIEPAIAIGRLYGLPYGYPMLDVPPEHRLALGTSEYLRDAALLAELDETDAVAPREAVGDWQRIEGELQTFDDPAARFPGLDRLENFRPGAESLYHRVALRLVEPRGRIVWTYVAANGRLPAGAKPIGSCWPSLGAVD